MRSPPAHNRDGGTKQLRMQGRRLWPRGRMPDREVGNCQRCCWEKRMWAEAALDGRGQEFRACCLLPAAHAEPSNDRKSRKQDAKSQLLMGGSGAKS